MITINNVIVKALNTPDNIFIIFIISLLKFPQFFIQPFKSFFDNII